jgi:PAS domain S-box-containing protein
VLYADGILSHVIARKEAERTLQKQLSLMQAIYTSAPDGLFMLDAEGRVTFMNPAGERMFGYTMPELQGKFLHDVCHCTRRDGSPLARAQCAIAQACASGKVRHGHEDVHFRKNGTPVDISFSSAPLFEGERFVGSVLAMQDITGVSWPSNALPCRSRPSRNYLRDGDFSIAMQHRNAARNRESSIAPKPRLFAMPPDIALGWVISDERAETRDCRCANQIAWLPEESHAEANS